MHRTCRFNMGWTGWWYCSIRGLVSLLQGWPGIIFLLFTASDNIHSANANAAGFARFIKLSKVFPAFGPHSNAVLTSPLRVLVLTIDESKRSAN
jgi:hypothetical protein